MARGSTTGRGRLLAVLAAGILVGTTMVSPAGAHITNNVAHAVKHMKKAFYTKAEVDQRLMWAAVNADGTLDRARGALDVSTFDGSDGVYLVSFASSVLDCAYTATVGSPNTDSGVGVVVAPGSAWVRGHDGYGGNVLEVFTHDRDGLQADTGFFLQVSC
ncbi:MAG: hypothetical protein WD826_09920 [Actinomycetota bacterium]